MPIGKKIIKNHIKGFKTEIDDVSSNQEKFFNWFRESGEDIQETFNKGRNDFNYHFASPLSKYMKNFKDKTILEIGCGGGRLLATSAELFKFSIGIDIHNQLKLVDDYIRKNYSDNFKLIQNNGHNIPIKDNSIDIVYSFLVFQHVEKIDIFKGYINEIHRILKFNGIAIIYFGRFVKFSYGSTKRIHNLLDYLIELIYLQKGYKEFLSEVNSTNLIISKRYAKALFKNSGFKILKNFISCENIENKKFQYGRQYGFILSKNH